MEILISLLTSGIMTTIVIIIAREGLKSMIENSIRYQFDQKLEDFKIKESKRQKAILIADLISEWISYPEDQKRLNKLTFEAFIWLPKETTIKLSKLLSHNPDAPSAREVLAEVRQLIMGSAEMIDPNSIIVFTKNKESQDIKK
jgi:hypothetical protein